jgi:hypothetical protein
METIAFHMNGIGHKEAGNNLQIVPAFRAFFLAIQLGMWAWLGAGIGYGP